jgi:hypothetical protein
MDPDDMSSRATCKENSGCDWLKQVGLLAIRLGPLCVEELDGGDGEANGHKEPDKMVDNFERRPFLGTKELPGPRGKN